MARLPARFTPEINKVFQPRFPVGVRREFLSLGTDGVIFHSIVPRLKILAKVRLRGPNQRHQRLALNLEAGRCKGLNDLHP